MVFSEKAHRIYLFQMLRRLITLQEDLHSMQAALLKYEIKTYS